MHVFLSMPRVAMLLALGLILGIAQEVSPAEPEDFMHPYKGVPPATKGAWAHAGNLKGPDFTIPTTGIQPVLVILLRSADPRDLDYANLFALDGDARVFNGTVIHPGNVTDFEKPAPPAKAFASAPTVVFAPDGGFEIVFAVDPDGQIYESRNSVFEYGRWTAWSKVPGTTPFQGQPFGLNAPDGKTLHLFVNGIDGHIYRNIYDWSAETWGAWQAIDSVRSFVPGPSGINDPNGTEARIFATDAEGIVQVRSYTWASGAFGPWTPVANTRKFKTGSSVVRFGNVMLVFATGIDGYIYYTEGIFGMPTPFAAWKHIYTGIEVKDAPSALVDPLEKEVLLSARTKYHGLMGIYGSIASGKFSTLPIWSAQYHRQAFGSGPHLAGRFSPRRRSQDVRSLFFDPSNSVADFYRENSYGKFTLEEAYTTEWLTAEDDPTTPAWDESSLKFLHTYDVKKKSAWVIEQVETRTPFRFDRFDDFPFEYDLAQERPDGADSMTPGGTVQAAESSNALDSIDASNTSFRAGDGVVNTAELAIFWVYPGQRVGGVRRGTDPYPVKVGSLSKGVHTFLVRATLGGGIPDDTYDKALFIASHELAHVLFDAPDMYGATDKKTNESLSGGGDYSLMASGGHLDAWHKVKLGWIRPVVAEKDGTYQLRAVEKHPDALILHNPARGTKEYFIVENRWPAGSYDEKINKQGGLAIWRIDETYPVEHHWGRYAIHLVRPSGIGADGSLWDAKSPTPEQMAWRDGTPSGIRITNITQAGPVVSITVDVP